MLSFFNFFFFFNFPLVCYYFSDYKKKIKKKKIGKTQNNDLFISPTNKSHKMDFFCEKAILEESNEPSYQGALTSSFICPYHPL